MKTSNNFYVRKIRGERRRSQITRNCKEKRAGLEKVMNIVNREYIEDEGRVCGKRKTQWPKRKKS